MTVYNRPVQYAGSPRKLAQNQSPTRDDVSTSRSVGCEVQSRASVSLSIALPPLPEMQTSPNHPQGFPVLLKSAFPHCVVKSGACPIFEQVVTQDLRGSRL